MFRGCGWVGLLELELYFEKDVLENSKRMRRREVSRFLEIGLSICVGIVGCKKFFIRVIVFIISCRFLRLSEEVRISEWIFYSNVSKAGND